MPREIVIPYAPRRVFLPYHQRKERFAAIVAHRRCGKTVACVNDILPRALTNAQPNGRYAYVAPLFSQAKDIAWDYLKRYAAPLLAKPPNESELWVELLTGARVRVYGADNPDRLRGAYLDGVILDEFADMRPSVWGEVIRPMLADRQGWATFIGTPKGRNDFWRICENALADQNWFYGRYPASVTAILPQSELDAARKDMTPEQYEQEFECSFEAAILGAYYGREIAEAERAGHLCEVPIVAGFPVHTAWDLGKGQNMPVWCFQVIAGEIRIVDFIQKYEMTIERMCAELSERGYHGTDYVPHDAKAPDLTTGRTRIESMFALGRKAQLVPDHNVMDGINAGRLLFPIVWFDAAKCAEGIEALRQYRADWDEKKRTFTDAPRHDWASHAADAFRYLAMAWRHARPEAKPKPKPMPGVPLNRLTMDELHELADQYAPDRSRI